MCKHACSLFSLLAMIHFQLFTCSFCYREVTMWEMSSAEFWQQRPDLSPTFLSRHVLMGQREYRTPPEKLPQHKVRGHISMLIIAINGSYMLQNAAYDLTVFQGKCIRFHDDQTTRKMCHCILKDSHII